MALVQPPPQRSELESPSANEFSTDNAENLVLLEKLENEKLYQLPHPRRAIFLSWTKIALFLIIAIFYHTFCLIVHHRGNVQIGGSGVLGLPFFQCEQYHILTRPLHRR